MRDRWPGRAAASCAEQSMRQHRPQVPAELGDQANDGSVIHDPMQSPAHFTETRIVSIRKQADAGMPVKGGCQEVGVSVATNYQWKSKCGGWMRPSSSACTRSWRWTTRR
jgi:hypothetical protein